MEYPVGHLFKIISDRLRAKANAEKSMRKNKLTLSQVRVLGFVADSSGKTTQKEIENHLEVSHPTVVGIISRMEKTGYLTSYIDPEDKRNKVVMLTDMATAISNQMRSDMMDREGQLLKGLSEQEISELRRMLNIIYNNLE